jgi:hypothetical protein
MSQALALSWTGGGTTWLVRGWRFAGGRPAALDQLMPPARVLRRFLATRASSAELASFGRSFALRIVAAALVLMVLSAVLVRGIGI